MSPGLRPPQVLWLRPARRTASRRRRPRGLVDPDLVIQGSRSGWSPWCDLDGSPVLFNAASCKNMGNSGSFHGCPRLWVLRAQDPPQRAGANFMRWTTSLFCDFSEDVVCCWGSLQHLRCSFGSRTLCVGRLSGSDCSLSLSERCGGFLRPQLSVAGCLSALASSATFLVSRMVELRHYKVCGPQSYRATSHARTPVRGRITWNLDEIGTCK